jgi:acetamidase/formamidase
MTERVINATEVIQDARMLLTCAAGALDEQIEVIEVTEELTCTPAFMVRTVLEMLNNIAHNEVLTQDAQLLLSSVKAQFAIAQMQGA